MKKEEALSAITKAFDVYLKFFGLSLMQTRASNTGITNIEKHKILDSKLAIAYATIKIGITFSKNKIK